MCWLGIGTLKNRQLLHVYVLLKVFDTHVFWSDSNVFSVNKFKFFIYFKIKLN